MEDVQPLLFSFTRRHCETLGTLRESFSAGDFIYSHIGTTCPGLPGSAHLFRVFLKHKPSLYKCRIARSRQDGSLSHNFFNPRQFSLFVHALNNYTVTGSNIVIVKFKPHFPIFLICKNIRLPV
jgi:hypothetical protein